LQALETTLTNENAQLRERVTKLEQIIANLGAPQDGFVRPQTRPNDAEAKTQMAQQWMKNIMLNAPGSPHMPFNTFQDMDDFNKKLAKDEEAPYMQAAADSLAPIAKQITSTVDLYKVVCGDWVTDNVSYARQSVSVT
jgi:hypothetical protein